MVGVKRRSRVVLQTSVIDAKKITAWGESGFPARFLAQDYLDAHPAIEWPDGLNRPGAYRIRQIAGIRRLFGDSVDDNTILSAGTLRPPVYMEADNSPGLLKQREEVERWKLQNESAVMTMVRRTAAPYTDVAHAFVTPLQLLTLARHHRPGVAGPAGQSRLGRRGRLPADDPRQSLAG